MNRLQFQNSFFFDWGQNVFGIVFAFVLQTNNSMFKFYFIILPFFLLGLIGCKHNVSPKTVNNGVTFVFSEDKEMDFLKQIVFDNHDFNNFILFEKSKDIGLEDVALVPSGLIHMNYPNKDIDTTISGKVFGGSKSISVSDSDFLLIYQQFLLNKIRVWNKQTANGRQVLTMEEDQKFMNQMGDGKEPDSISLMRKQLGVGGRLEMSHPIFFGGGRQCLFSFRTIDADHKENDECNVYWKNDKGLWMRQQSLMTRLRQPKVFHYK